MSEKKGVSRGAGEAPVKRAVKHVRRKGGEKKRVCVRVSVRVCEVRVRTCERTCEKSVCTCERTRVCVRAYV